jgi:hypothetical protein
MAPTVCDELRKFYNAKSEEGNLFIPVAPYFGMKPRSYLIAVSDDIILATLDVVQALSKVPLVETNWERLTQELLQCSSLAPASDELSKRDKFTKANEASWFNFSGKPNKEVTEKMVPWLKHALGDMDIVEAMVDIDALAESIARVGRAVEDSVVSKQGQSAADSRRVMDITALKYAGQTGHLFKLFRVVIDVWASADWNTVYEKGHAGAKLEVYLRDFKIKESVVQLADQERIKNARADVGHIFHLYPELNC